MTAATRINGLARASASRNGRAVASVTRDGSVTASGARSIVVPREVSTHPTIDAAPEKARPILSAFHALYLEDPDDAREALRLARALLDRDDHGVDPELDRALSDLTQETISKLDRNPGLTLATVSLTAPTGTRAVLEPLRTIAAGEAANDGAMLAVVDYRPRDGVEHGYAIVLSHDVASTVSGWIDLVGSTPRANRATTVSGWRKWTRSEARGHEVLTENLRTVFGYAVKAHPIGSDLDAVSTASGVFTSSWVVFVERFRALRLGDMPRAVTRTCARCGVSVPPTKRRDADTCSPACRQALYRARNGSQPMAASVTRGERR